MTMFIVLLPLLFKILENICVVIIFCPVCDVKNVEINLSFLIMTFFYLTKEKSGQKCKDPKNKNNF